MRRGVVLIGLVAALLAGCGGAHRSAPPVRHHVQRKPPPRRPVSRAQLVVTVLDGDRLVRVRGARVRILHTSDVTNRRGVAVMKGPERRLVVSVKARGYTPVSARVDFCRRKQTIRIYEPRLQWPFYGATPARTGAQTAIKLRPPFTLVWSRAMGRLIEFPAVVWDGFAYIGNARSTIHAISMRNGAIAWTHDTPGAPRMAASPAVFGKDVVYHTMGGWVYVLDRADGKVVWSWNAGSPIEPSPVVLHGIDYFGTAAGRVDALDLDTHRLRWSRSLGSKITSSAAIEGGRLFIGDYAGRLWALSPATGATRWVGQVNGKIYGTPAVSDGRVFVPSSTGNSLTAFTTSGRYLWRIDTGNYVYSSPAVWRGRVVFGSFTGAFYGADAATGHVAWRVYTGAPISGAAVVVDGVAYAGSFSHRIFGVNIRTGRTVLIFRHGEYVPVSGNGQRLLLNGFSRLYAVQPRATVRHRVRHAHTRQHRKAKHRQTAC